MKKTLLTLLTTALIFSIKAQQLSVEQIMQDPKFTIGALPSNIFWAEDSKTIYFNWNPDKNKADSLYGASVAEKKPFKIAPQVRRALPSNNGNYSTDFGRKVYSKNGDLFLMDCRTMAIRQITNTVESESNPSFNSKDDKIVFTKGNNLFSFNISNGEIDQLTNFQAGTKKPEPKLSEQEKWQKQDQLTLFDILKERSDKKKEGDKIQKADLPKRAKEIFVEDKNILEPQLSPDEKYITYRLSKSATGAKSAFVPSYVTESGFTEDLPARTKVGATQTSYEFWVYDIKKDTALQVLTKAIEGIFDEPDYLKDYVKKSLVVKKDTAKKKPEPRKVIFSNVIWSEDGKYCVLVVKSQDNKDRWIMRLDPATQQLQTIDRQRDEAWIGGPGIGFGGNVGTMGFLADNQTLYFQSEADGYSHLYAVNLSTSVRKQLTKGKFEVQSVQLSRDKQNFYLTTNEVNPGEQHFYRMAVAGGVRTRLTKMTGSNQVVLSPDETKLAYLNSFSNRPWEVFLQENDVNNSPSQITKSQSRQFKEYKWREPEIITFKAEDGQDVYARLYESKTGEQGKKPAVIFVHGAGYLQNVHKWWSQYFREYMFHNMLVDNGYTVLDIDYRGSAGYGRDWRTGIYRFMGGKDLSDHVDAAKYLVEQQGIDYKKIGIYGGSYGGFITLMAMFTKPDVFAAGAALRPVTDWAAYNHPYTANILNEPQADSIAYQRSSPIYHAEGLKGNLLICHGMVDVNVHYQDAVRLSQRLIELRKEHWELASYPMEDHGFVEPTSWMDEYKRIFKLFETTLKK
ncbi:MAG: alpha/beta fold hydrolase [Bacteroidota bacterium]